MFSFWLEQVLILDFDSFPFLEVPFFSLSSLNIPDTQTMTIAIIKIKQTTAMTQIQIREWFEEGVIAFEDKVVDIMRFEESVIGGKVAVEFKVAFGNKVDGGNVVGI